MKTKNCKDCLHKPVCGGRALNSKYCNWYRKYSSRWVVNDTGIHCEACGAHLMDGNALDFNPTEILGLLDENQYCFNCGCRMFNDEDNED